MGRIKKKRKSELEKLSEQAPNCTENLIIFKWKGADYSTEDYEKLKNPQKVSDHVVDSLLNQLKSHKDYDLYKFDDSDCCMLSIVLMAFFLPLITGITLSLLTKEQFIGILGFILILMPFVYLLTKKTKEINEKKERQTIERANDFRKIIEVENSTIDQRWVLGEKAAWLELHLNASQHNLAKNNLEFNL